MSASSTSEVERLVRIIDGLDAKTCPVTDCGKKTPRGYWLCREHWALVPDLLKGEVREAANRKDMTWDDWASSAQEALRVVEDEVAEAAA